MEWMSTIQIILAVQIMPNLHLTFSEVEDTASPAKLMALQV